MHTPHTTNFISFIEGQRESSGTYNVPCCSVCAHCKMNAKTSRLRVSYLFFILFHFWLWFWALGALANTVLCHVANRFLSFRNKKPEGESPGHWHSKGRPFAKWKWIYVVLCAIHRTGPNGLCESSIFARFMADIRHTTFESIKEMLFFFCTLRWLNPPKCFFMKKNKKQKFN